MSKSKELATTSGIVKRVLETHEKARNSDNYLYYQVCSIIGSQRGIDINKMSVPAFFLKLSESPFPAFETVRRTRQKIQASHPWLRGDDNVEAHRTLNEEVFRNYARKVSV